MSRSCSRCGGPATPGARFCSHCGSVLTMDAGQGPGGPTERSSAGDATVLGRPGRPATSPSVAAPQAGADRPTGAYAARPRRRSGAMQLLAIGVVAAALVITGFLVGSALLSRNGSGPGTARTGGASASPSTAAASASPSVHAADAAGTAAGESAPVDARYHLYRRAGGVPGIFSQVGTLHGSTSQEFMVAVADAYAGSGAAGGPAVLTGVFSPATGKVYTVNCAPQSDGTVLCTGGNNARILLFR